MMKLAIEQQINSAKRLTNLSTVLALCFYSATFCSAYPNGGPDIACETMFPSGHGNAPQETPPPYQIVPVKTAYRPGETISVILEAKKGFFTGIYVQAHSSSCPYNSSRLPVGVFTSLDREFQTRHCYGIVHSTLTQTNARIKIKERIFWTAPVKPAGDVVIKATFVKDVNTFWTDVYSSVLFDLRASQKECIHDDVSKHNFTTLISSPVTHELRTTQPIITETQHVGLSLAPHHINAAAKNNECSKPHIVMMSIFLGMWTSKTFVYSSL